VKKRTNDLVDNPARFLAHCLPQLGTEQINSMRNEVEVVTEELLDLADSTMIPTPALRELIRRRDAARAATAA